MRNVTLGVALLLVMAACGGGGGDEATTTTTTAGTSSEPVTTTTSSSNGDDGPGSNTEFCQFDAEVNTSLDTLLSFNATALEDAVQQTVQLANQATDVAPSEIENAAMVLLGGFTGFADFLQDINYDPINNQDAFLTDPRVLYLDSAEYTAAADAVEEFCGSGDDDDSPSLTIPGTDITIPDVTDGTLPPDVVSDDLPDDFPNGWVPPGVTSVQTIEPGIGFQVSFMTDASFDDVVAHYTNEEGAPQSNIDAGGVKSAQWFLGDGTIIIVQATEGVVIATVAGA